METTLLIAAARSGDKAAEARLFRTLYGDLQRMAQHHLLRSGSDVAHAESLVHEVYLRMVGGGLGMNDRRHFFALASRAMRQIVVDHVRRRSAAKRNDGVAEIPLELVQESALASMAAGQDEDLLNLETALQRLERIDDALARLVELHFFGGLGFAEMAEVLERSERSLKRDWRKAKAFLYHDLAHEQPG